MKYVHTNIISKDWKKLAGFYERVFDCTPVPPARDLKGEWLDEGTGLKNAQLTGIHMKLPGYDENGPTLEIFSYTEVSGSDKPAANRLGFGHIAFRVDSVENMVNKALKEGASKIGEITSHPVEGVGQLTFIYISDPDGNIIEIQKWD